MPRGGKREREFEIFEPDDELELRASKAPPIPSNPTFEDTFLYARFLRDQIRINYYPDYFIPISTGGVYLLANLLKVGLRWAPTIGFDIVSKEKERIAGLNNHISRIEMRNKRILAVEDILETGQSANLIKRFAELNGGEFKLACILSRPGGDIKPDYFLASGVSREVTMSWEEMGEKYSGYGELSYE